MTTKTKFTTGNEAISLLNECIKNIRNEMKMQNNVQVTGATHNGSVQHICIETPTFGLNLNLK